MTITQGVDGEVHVEPTRESIAPPAPQHATLAALEAVGTQLAPYVAFIGALGIISDALLERRR